MSTKQHYSHFLFRNLIFLTFQSHICLGRIFGIQNLRKINFLKGDFSSLPGFLPSIFILCTSQVDKFTGYLTIKFSEYNYQRNCKGSINICWSICDRLAKGKEVTIVKGKQCPQNHQAKDEI